MNIHEVLEYKKKYNKPPRANSVYDVLRLVEEYLVYLYENGGELNFNVNLKYNKDVGNYFRLSSSGKCVRAIAYSLYVEKYYKEGNDLKDLKKISPRSVSVFQLGHTLHELERLLISEVNELTSLEEDVELTLDNGEKVKGHIDGILKLSDRDVLIDVKTVNEKAYKEFMKAPREDYVYQLNAYMHATGIKESYLWVYNKGTSHRMIIPVRYDELIVHKLKKNFELAFESFKSNALPPKPFEPIVKEEGNVIVKTLPWQCSYCNFVKMCWPDFEMQVDSQQKVKHVKVDIKEEDDAWI